MELVKVRNKSADITDEEYADMVSHFRKSELMDIDYLVKVISAKEPKKKIKTKIFKEKFKITFDD